MRKALSQSVVRQLLGAIDVRSPFGPRDYFMLVFALHTGLRISEWTGLCVGDVAHQGVPRDEVLVSKAIAKFGKPRHVPLNPVAQKAIARVLAFNQARGFSVSPDAPLWVNRYHRPVGPRWIQYTVKALVAKAGIPAPCVPHQLRHSYATAIMEVTGNLRYVQALLGHAKLSTVECYTVPSWAELQKATYAIAKARS